MTQDIDALFQKTKGNLFFKKGSGFLGSLLAKVQFQWTTEIPTAAISDKTLYWNPDFFRTLDKDTRVTVLAHELWHNGLLHGARLNERCPEIWNVAADHVINLRLKEDGYYMGGFPYIMDPKYTGWSTDEVYDDLIAPGQPQPQPCFIGQDILPIDAKDVPAAVANVVAAKSVAQMTNQAGNLPGEVSVVIDHFLNPKLPWETILFNFFNALTSQEYSYARPNRRYEDPIMPGVTGRNGLEHLIYYLDISGSITDEEILRFNSEVKFIQEELQPEKLTLVTFDTEIHDEYVFEKDDPFEKIVVTGRGGTDLHDVFEHAKAHRPTAMIIFTDLWVNVPENPGIPIIWVCVNNKDGNAPFGQLIHIEEKAR
jgi:predicted metal-dependent peptidase